MLNVKLMTMLELSEITVRNLLVEAIRKEIVCGNYVPGQRLRLRDLAEQYKVSTQPIREALSELEADGLVSSEPRKGAVVTQLSVAELEDIYDIRATLEQMATRFAVPVVSAETLTHLEDLITQMDNKMGEVADLVQLNSTFHLTLYEASGRTHLCELIKTLRHRASHYLHAYMITLGGMPPAQDEHRIIVDACRAGDAEQAGAIMYDHVMKAGIGIIKTLE